MIRTPIQRPDRKWRALLMGVLLSGAVLINPMSMLPAQASTLEVALGLLLLEHPAIKAAEKTQEGTRAGIQIAEAGFLPRVSLTADVGPQYIDTPTTRDAGSTYVRPKNVATLTMSQTLFDGDLSASGVRAARITKETAAITLEQTKQRVLFEGIQAYLSVLKQKRLVDLGHENVANIQHQIDLEEERLEKGSGVAIDVLEAQSRLQISLERLVQYEGELQNSATRYKQVFSRMPDYMGMEDPWPPVDLIPTTLDLAVEKGLQYNPIVNSSAANVELARENRLTAKADYFPTVNLEGTANFEKNNDTTIGIRRDYALLLRASWDLFSGLSTPSSVDKATYDYRASQDSHISVERKLIEQVHLAWQTLLTARKRASLLETAVNIAAEVYVSRVKLREAGKETIINVLDAENKVTSAQINYTTTSYDARTSAYQLLLSMGQLTPEGLNLPSS